MKVISKKDVNMDKENMFGLMAIVIREISHLINEKDWGYTIGEMEEDM